jgi:hypothetical protein
MENDNQVPARGVAGVIAKGIVRLWPEETRDWGLAFAAELAEMENPSEARRWIAGGVMLLARERWKSFVNSWWRPLGVPAQGELNSVARNGSGFPRMPRFLTALLLLASLAILLHPDVRRCIASVISGYSSNVWEWAPSKWHSVKKLKAEAQRNHDPQLLAFLSLLANNSDEQAQLSREAIRRDPSLTWIDYVSAKAASRVPDATTIARLEQWDPDNAAVHFLEAGYITETHNGLHGDDGRHYLSYHPPGPLLKDQEWLVEMDRAFSSARYDNYADRELGLLRDIVGRYHVDDPDLSVALLTRLRFDGAAAMLAYADVLAAQGQAEEDRGNNEAALAIYRKIDRLPQLMHLTSCDGANIGCLTAIFGENRALERLQPLLQKMGRNQEAELAGLRLASNEALRLGFRRDGQMWDVEGWTGLFIRLAVPAILCLAVASLFCSAFLWIRAGRIAESWRWLRGSLSYIADSTPLLLLFMSGSLFCAYRPYAQDYRILLSNARSFGDAERLSQIASVTRILPGYAFDLQDFFFGPNGGTVLWAGITLALAVAAAVMIYRMMNRREPSTTSAGA